MKETILEITISNSESVLDSLLENGLLKDIPILGNIVSALKLKGDITNFLFAKKLETFLTKLKSGNIDEIDPSIVNVDMLRKIGSDLVFILEKASNLDKAKWLAQAVIYLTERRYDLDTFERLIYVIDRFSPTLKGTMDIWYLKQNLSGGDCYAFLYDPDHPEELANLGLLKRKYEAKVTNDGIIPVRYEECNLGQQLWHIIEKA